MDAENDLGGHDEWLLERIEAFTDNGRYSGGFLELLDGPFAAIGVLTDIDMAATRRMLESAERIVDDLTQKDRHFVAAHMETVLSRRHPREEDDPNVERADEGDPDLWLEAIAAEPDALGTGQSALSEAAKPISVAQTLAVMALWKAGCAVAASRRRGQLIRDLPNHLPGRPDGLGTVARIGLRVREKRDIRRFTYEITRAVTLAEQILQLEQSILQIHATSSAELERIYKEQSRHAASRGGIARAERFKKYKQRIIELAPRFPESSREKTAAKVRDALEAEAIEVNHRFVVDALREHDKAIAATRSTHRPSA